MKYYTIPVFVPELACPNRCVFCNQHSISGCHAQPDIAEVKTIIEERLATIAESASVFGAVHTEIGFFGGNFTGIDEILQREYLSIAFDYLKKKQIQGIRLSTRPDYINTGSLALLKEYGVTTIELGAQSLDAEVLYNAGRGHTIEDIEKASALVRKHGFELGLQMMTGLPGDTPEKSLETARKIIALGAGCTRIYPTMVIRGTELEKLYDEGSYKPQTLEEAVELTARLLDIFERSDVKVIRVGLHPSEDLIQGGELIAGPFHVAFRQLAETYRWRIKLQNSKAGEDGVLRIEVPRGQLNNAVGYNGSNRLLLEQQFTKVIFTETDNEDETCPLIIADKRIPLPAKNALSKEGQLVLLEMLPGVYKTIAGHPDIFLCAGETSVVVAPAVPEIVVSALRSRNLKVTFGSNNPGNTYPASAMYNAVVTDRYLIHNLKITDAAVMKEFVGLEQIHVNQGYTRCNVLMLGPDCAVTSDRGIEKVLTARGFDVLFVNPEPVVLKGQKHGFFPGCCGISDKTIIINGNLKYHPDERVIREFIEEHGFKTWELFDGKLTDAGSLLIF